LKNNKQQQQRTDREEVREGERKKMGRTRFWFSLGFMMVIVALAFVSVFAGVGESLNVIDATYSV